MSSKKLSTSTPASSSWRSFLTRLARSCFLRSRHDWKWRSNSSKTAFTSARCCLSKEASTSSAVAMRTNTELKLETARICRRDWAMCCCRSAGLLRCELHDTASVYTGKQKSDVWIIISRFTATTTAPYRPMESSSCHQLNQTRPMLKELKNMMVRKTCSTTVGSLNQKSSSDASLFSMSASSRMKDARLLLGPRRCPLFRLGITRLFLRREFFTLSRATSPAGCLLDLEPASLMRLNHMVNPRACLGVRASSSSSSRDWLRSFIFFALITS
mmetsp:Transcript_330/g.703  ORF Transcript_330/g.703 Transcript_330/m.703 type:complete len:272 (-) Transcript_330:78-893(-)